MSPPVPKTAMVFAAGLGTRMRPITETLPKPLVKVRGRALIDYCLDRLAENGVERAIVNVHWLADQIEAHLAKRHAPKDHHLGRTGRAARSGRRHQARAAADRRRSVPHLQHRRVLDRGAALEHCPPGPEFRSGDDGHSASGRGRRRRGRRRLARRFRDDPRRAASARDPRHVAPFVYTGVGIVKPQLFADETADVFRLAPFFHAAAAQGRLYGVRLDGLWVHVGRPESIAEAEAAIDRSIL